jgi:hypothetical protein
MSEIKYDINGQEVCVIQKLDGDKGWLVLSLFDDNDGRYCDEEHPFILSKIFDNPPVLRYSIEIKTLKKEISRLKEEKENALLEKKEAEKKRDEVVDKIKNHAALHNIFNFIDGKITHYVTMEGYREPEIHSFDEAMDYKNDYIKRYGEKLLVLFGGSKGDLQWKINNYSDGSGRYIDVIPCLSFKEAEEKIKEWVNSEFKNHPELEVIKLAKQYNIKIPTEYIEEYKSRIKKYNEKREKERDEQAKKDKQNLENIEDL